MMSERAQFLEKVIGYKMYVLIIPTTRLKHLILKIEQEMIKNVYWSSHKLPAVPVRY
jgi:hypothetical protein